MTAAAAPPTGRGRAAPWVLALIWVALTVGLLFAAARVPWNRALAEMARVHSGWIAVAVLANLAILPLWALEWRLLVPGPRAVPAGRMFGIVAITASVLNSVPFLAGEASAVVLLVTQAGLTRGAALSVLAMDQLLVAFAKLAVLGAAIAIAPVPAWVRAGGLLLMTALVAGLAVVLPLAHRWERIRSRLLAAPTPLRARLAAVVQWGEHLALLREPRRLPPLALLALAKKAAELSAIVAIQAAFGLAPSLATGVLVLAALALSTLVPVAPANLGVYEATVFAIYRLMGVPPETAVGIALVQHVAFLLPSLLTGYLVLSWRPFRRDARAP